MKNHSIRLNEFAITVLVSCAVCAFYLTSNNFLPRLESLEQDLFYNLRGPLVPGDDIVIASIDEKSIDMLGRWPWSRDIVASLLTTINDYGASVIGLDVVFSSPESDSGLTYLQQIDALLKDWGDCATLSQVVRDGIIHADHDQALFDALDRAQNVVLGYFFHFSSQGLEHLSEKEMESSFDTIAFSRFTSITKKPGSEMDRIPLRQAFAVESSIDRISQGAMQMGYFNFVPMEDGVIRKIPLIVRYKDALARNGDSDYLFPPLSLNILNEYLKTNTVIATDSLGVEKIALAGETLHKLPISNLGEMWINYYGPRGTFPHISAVDIINRQITGDKLKGKIVLVGATATAIEDLHTTPFDTMYPGVNIHATIMDNVLSKRTLADPVIPKKAIDLIGIASIGLLLFSIVPRLSAIGIGVLYMTLAAGLIGASYFFFSQFLIVVSSVTILMELTAVALALYVSRFIMEEKEKRYIMNAFSKYLSPVVIAEILKNPSKLRLGGERRQMTVFFSDIAGFSAISEKMPPEDLVSLLNDYLTEMTAIILKYDGTVDKYEGDAIIAFFGAPLEVQDHARRCCFMALDMKEKLKELNKRWSLAGKPTLEVRMGINSGQMVVGNMGSALRMDYTVMGDAVNLAARLEGANKVYRTNIMLSEDTLLECSQEIEVRELDVIRVVGKKKSVRVYELLGRSGELSAEKQDFIKHYKNGLQAYQQKNWEEGFALFEKLSTLRPDDGPAEVYRQRCMNYRARAPEPQWDGVFSLNEK